MRTPSLGFAFLLVLPAWAQFSFVDVADETGLHFRHEDGRSGKRYYIETAASGGGFFDFDNDGDLDIYLVNGALTPGSEPGPLPHNGLFENRDGRFVDVTKSSGTGDPGYGMGICIGDFDGDGRADLFVSNYGADALYRNLGNGRFENIAANAGVDGTRWGTACAFGDVDGDGDLDLYVTNYVHFTYAENRLCGSPTANVESYCRPDVFDGTADYLYINQGDGTFREEGAARGILQGTDEKGFGVMMSDLDDDGDLDIAVANDGTENRLYINDGTGKFEENGLLSGFALNGNGQTEAGMGIDIADVDGNGTWDIFVTNYAGESNTLHSHLGDLLFEDITQRAGLAAPSLDPVGWGTRFFDADNDGDLDLAVANGHVMDNIAKIYPERRYPQPDHLYQNDNGRFRLVKGSGSFAEEAVSRGLAVGDWNNDGRLDVLVTTTNGAPRLLENRGKGGNWLGLQLVGKHPNRQAIGASVRVIGDKGLIGRHEIRSGGSFLSQNDLRVHQGLGKSQGPLTVSVRWPNGQKSSHTIEKVNQYQTIEQP